MKLNFFTFIFSSLITIVALIGSIIIEFWVEPFVHSGYYSNILLGIFASGLLLVVASFIGYLSCKNEYYLNISDELINLSEIILLFTEELKDCSLESSQVYVSTINSRFYNAKLLYDSEIGFYKSKRDKLIELLLLKILGYLSLQKVLDDYYRKQKKHQICNNHYTEAYMTIVTEMYNFSHTDLKYAQKELMDLSDKSKKWGHLYSKLIK